MGTEEAEKSVVAGAKVHHSATCWGHFDKKAKECSQCLVFQACLEATVNINTLQASPAKAKPVATVTPAPVVIATPVAPVVASGCVASSSPVHKKVVKPEILATPVRTADVEVVKKQEEDVPVEEIKIEVKKEEPKVLAIVPEVAPVLVVEPQKDDLDQLPIINMLKEKLGVEPNVKGGFGSDVYLFIYGEDKGLQVVLQKASGDAVFMNKDGVKKEFSYFKTVKVKGGKPTKERLSYQEKTKKIQEIFDAVL
jgi:hypothetical protein